ncbi:MAG: CopD family protein [Neisseria sp.]|nr:CopD family protein [Neisseria sp.]
MYLWFKFFHIFFMISWFAGLFYLPRVFVNLATAEQDSGEYGRLLGMARRLMRFMQPLMVGALLFGLLIPFVTGWWGQGWVHVKATAGVLLLAYHLYCGVLLKRFSDGANTRSHRWFRVFNEIPVFLMIAALLAVVFKPF